MIFHPEYSGSSQVIEDIDPRWVGNLCLVTSLFVGLISLHWIAIGPSIAITIILIGFGLFFRNCGFSLVFVDKERLCWIEGITISRIQPKVAEIKNIKALHRITTHFRATSRDESSTTEYQYYLVVMDQSCLKLSISDAAYKVIRNDVQFQSVVFTDEEINK